MSVLPQNPLLIFTPDLTDLYLCLPNNNHSPTTIYQKVTSKWLVLNRLLWRPKIKRLRTHIHKLGVKSQSTKRKRVEEEKTTSLNQKKTDTPRHAMLPSVHWKLLYF